MNGPLFVELVRGRTAVHVALQARVTVAAQLAIATAALQAIAAGNAGQQTAVAALQEMQRQVGA